MIGLKFAFQLDSFFRRLPNGSGDKPDDLPVMNHSPVELEPEGEDDVTENDGLEDLKKVEDDVDYETVENDDLIVNETRNDINENEEVIEVAKEESANDGCLDSKIRSGMVY